jgi:hypothetical protein
VPNSTNKLLLELARNPTEALRLLPPKNMQLPESAMTTWSTPILKLSMKIKRRAEDKLKLEGDEKTGLEIVRRAVESPLRQLAGTGWKPTYATLLVAAALA